MSIEMGRKYKGEAVSSVEYCESDGGGGWEGGMLITGLTLRRLTGREEGWGGELGQTGESRGKTVAQGGTDSPVTSQCWSAGPDPGSSP